MIARDDLERIRSNVRVAELGAGAAYRQARAADYGDQRDPRTAELLELYTHVCAVMFAIDEILEPVVALADPELTT